MKSLQQIREAKDDAEYNDEGGMAISQLKTAKSAVEELMSIIKDDDNLPEWVQSKLTKAVDYMDSVRDYMSSEKSNVKESVELDEAEYKVGDRMRLSNKNTGAGSNQKIVKIDMVKGKKRYELANGQYVYDENTDVEESSAAWAKSLETMAKKKQLDQISDKDKETLMKIAAMMAKEKK